MLSHGVVEVALCPFGYPRQFGHMLREVAQRIEDGPGVLLDNGRTVRGHIEYEEERDSVTRTPGGYEVAAGKVHGVIEFTLGTLESNPQ